MARRDQQVHVSQAEQLTQRDEPSRSIQQLQQKLPEPRSGTSNQESNMTMRPSYPELVLEPLVDYYTNSAGETRARDEEAWTEESRETLPMTSSDELSASPLQSQNLLGNSFVHQNDIQFSHTEYRSQKAVPFSTVKQLGHGSLGVVDAVRMDRWATELLLARKIILLRRMDRKRLLPIIQQEIDVLRKLKHDHIVQIVCTYETMSIPRQFGIIIFPAGDEDLSHFLERIGENKFPNREVSLLRKWQYCLASAVAYVHEKCIRHKDIKPANIICKNEQIFLADFGSAGQFSSGLTSTTEGYAAGITRMYSAPEVIEQEPRGRPADIYSLGCVFAEMATVMNFRRVDEFHEYRSEPDPNDSERITLLYSVTSHKLESWFTELGDTWTSDLLADMLRADPKSRPTAKELLVTIAIHLGDSRCSCNNIIDSSK